MSEPRHVVAKVSGGTGSYSAARRHVDHHGTSGLSLLFTDTLCEDQDAYRFLIASAANLYSVSLPAGFLPEIAAFPAWEDRDAYKAFVTDLGARTRALMPDFHWIADGRDPWDVYEAERFLGNSRVDPCSKFLKRQLADRWLRANCDPAQTIILVGIDYEERERFEGNPKLGTAGIQRRWREIGWTCEAPLCDKPYLSWLDRRNRLFLERLWLPRLNALGFSHNNCGGFCCKGGQGHWKLMLRAFPERYAYAERRESEIREKLGDVSMLTDRRGGGAKKPLTLEALRTRDLRPDEASEMGACNCFFGDDNEIESAISGMMANPILAKSYSSAKIEEALNGALSKAKTRAGRIENKRAIEMLATRAVEQRQDVFLIAADVADNGGIGDDERKALDDIAKSLNVDGAKLLG